MNYQGVDLRLGMAAPCNGTVSIVGRQSTAGSSEDNFEMTDSCVCPACHATGTALKFTLSSAQAAQHFVQEREYPDLNRKLRLEIERLWDRDSCQIRSCEACGFGFSWPFVAGGGLFYNLAYPYTTYPKAKWEFTRTLAALDNETLAGKSAIEIGAGFGFFLDMLRERGASPSLLKAIEFNQLSADQLSRKGYDVIQEDVRSPVFRSMEGTFDYIFLFQVLEHMDDLDALFDRLTTLLKPGGSIFLSVPNTVYTDYQESNRLLIDMPPNHIGRWTVASLQNICARHGIHLREHAIQPFSLPLFLRTDLVFSHIRRSQDKPASLSALARSMPRSRFRTITELAAMAAGSLQRIPSWCWAWPCRSTLGLSMWAHLKRQ